MATAVADKTEARIREADAAADRRARTRMAELDFAQKERALKATRLAEETARKQAIRDSKRTAKQQRKQQRSAARKARRTQVWGRFVASLDGQLVTVLVCLAASAAWHGQFHYLVDKGVPVPFAAAAATALEVFGLAMGKIAREAGQVRERAVRVRMFMWAVVGFSAASNYDHNGPVLAVLSVAGPAAWEIREWWQHRAALHAAGLLRPRPVRPRFPADQAVLFPVWTLRAYRVAVRDRIEDTTVALSVAKTEMELKAAERAARRAARTLGRQAKKWAPVVRSLVDAERKAATETAEATLAKANEMLYAASLVWGPDALRDVADATETTENAVTRTTEDPRPKAGDRGDRRQGTEAARQTTGLAGTTEATQRTTGAPASETTGNRRSAAAEQTTDATGDLTTETTERPTARRGRRLSSLLGRRAMATEAQTTETTETGQATERQGGEGPAVPAQATGTTADATDDRQVETTETTAGRHDRGLVTGTTDQAAEATGQTTGTTGVEATGTTETTEARLSVASGRPGDRDDRTTETTDQGDDRKPTTETTGQAAGTTDVDVSDLLPAALEIGARLGDRLARDPLLEGLRQRGLKVGGRRRAAIYEAVQAALRKTTTAKAA